MGWGCSFLMVPGVLLKLLSANFATAHFIASLPPLVYDFRAATALASSIMLEENSFNFPSIRTSKKALNTMGKPKLPTSFNISSM